MRLLIRVASVIALTVIGCAAAQADLYSASEAYKAKDYQKAFAEFRELAELGNPQSQFVLGLLYCNGQGVMQNRLVGYGWVRLAADAGYALAQELEPKLRAEIDEENVDRARGLLSKFTPDALASRIYPKVLENCDYQDQSMVRAKIIQRSMGDIDAAYPLALRQKGVEGSVAIDLLVGDDGVVRDVRVLYAIPQGAFEEQVVKMASKWKYEPATQNGKPVPSSEALMINFKMRDSGDYSKADRYVQKMRNKAEQGDASAQYTYGLILIGHPHYRKLSSDALPWFIKAAQSGLAAAQYRVGHSLLSGRGCEKDLVKAREWMMLAARQDYSDAQIELARMSLKIGSQYEPDKAIFWLENAAKNGSIKGKKYLASILAASTIEKLRDPKRAQVLVEDVLNAEPDDVVGLETKAAALAATSDFAQAVTIEQSALKSAKKKGWNTKDLEERLSAYNQKQTWQGELLTF